jgi:hypothetical protein
MQVGYMQTMCGYYLGGNKNSTEVHTSCHASNKVQQKIEQVCKDYKFAKIVHSREPSHSSLITSCTVFNCTVHTYRRVESRLGEPFSHMNELLRSFGCCLAQQQKHVHQFGCIPQIMKKNVKMCLAYRVDLSFLNIYLTFVSQ